jgi:hypothetical protein
MNVAEGHILKKTRNANRQSGWAFRRQHKAPTRSVIKKTMQAIQRAFRRQHNAPARSVITKTMQTIQKSGESPRK